MAAFQAWWGRHSRNAKIALIAAAVIVALSILGALLTPDAPSGGGGGEHGLDDLLDHLR